MSTWAKGHRPDLSHRVTCKRQGCGVCVGGREIEDYVRQLCAQLAAGDPVTKEAGETDGVLILFFL